MIYAITTTGKIHLFSEVEEGIEEEKASYLVCACDNNIKPDIIVSNEYAEFLHSDKICIVCKMIAGKYFKNDNLPDSSLIVKRHGICKCSFECYSNLEREHDNTRFLINHIIICPICAKNIEMIIKQNIGVIL